MTNPVTTAMPTAPAGESAVTITVGIDAVKPGAKIFGLNCLSHRANITTGFSDNSFKGLSPTKQSDLFSMSKAYVEFKSDKFLASHFVLAWTVPRIDQARCMMEPLSPLVPGKPQTTAFALTLVSNLDLDPEEHGKL